MAREFTARMLELNDEGLFNKDILIQDLLSFLSENEVKAFVKASDFIGFEDLGFTSSHDVEEEELAEPEGRWETDAWYDTSSELY